MKCIVLAAGYATRLYPLTKDWPKPLLDIAGKPMIEHIMAKVELCEAIDDVYVVTNARFYEQFRDWAEGYQTRMRVVVVNDQTTTNENRLGAIADLQYVIEQCEIRDDVLVMAGDNLFDFDLRDFVAFYERVGRDCITVHALDDVAKLQRTGVAEVDADGRVISFEEKPVKPRSNLAVPPFYIYRRETLPYVAQYLDEGNEPDAPGYFVPWLIGKKEVYAYEFEGERYDIGTLESYEAVQRIYENNR